jgi:OmpA-OmpF porin, OOP family
MFKKIVALSIVGLTSISASTSFATPAQTPYAGLQLGWGNVHQSIGHVPAPIHFSQKDTGLAGRLNVGYQIDDTWGVEMGWTRFSDATFRGSYAGIGLASANIKTNTIDLVVKGSVPVANQVKAFGKLGAAYVMSRASANVVGYHYSDKQNKLLPTATAGVSYEFSDQVSADLSYTRVQKVGNTKLVNSTDFVGIGLTYSFS